MNQTLATLRPLFDHPGPFATVHLDATRATESGGHEVALRWAEVRAQLVEQGADKFTIRALDNALDEVDSPGPHGRLLVAAEGHVLFDEPLSIPPARSEAEWSAVPHLLPFVAEQESQIPHAVVVVNHSGADIVVHPRMAEQRTASVEGSRQYPLHKTASADWSERHFQNRVDNSVAINAGEAAKVAADLAAKAAAEVVVVAGDPRSASLLREELTALLPEDIDVFAVESGGRAAGSSEQALKQAVDDQLWRRIWRKRRQLLARLQQDLGRGVYAVQGALDVVNAIRRGQVDTVVLQHDPASTERAWVGPEPLQLGSSEQELRDMGVAEPQQDRLDAALLRAAIGSGADLVTTPNGHSYVDGGIAALLRYN